MKRVAWLLDPRNEGYSYRLALVRLWSLAANDQLLNKWEQQENENTIPPHVADIADKIQDEHPIDLAVVESHPLALIRALDDYLCSMALSTSNSTVTSQSAYKVPDDGKCFWLLPIGLAARRKAAMNGQPARRARWFQNHAVVPCSTAHGIEVTCSLARSALHSTLAQLASQPNGVLRAWVAHFDDGADVVWDRTSSPIGNWRTQCIEPHDARQASMVQTLASAAKAGALVVVFPEFTLDLKHRQQLAAYLRQNPSEIQLVIAGAFHEPENATDPASAYNTAPVLTGNGRQLFVHRKLRLFGKRNVGAEFAQVGNGLHVLVTPLGCMTVLICKDFMDEDPRVDNLLAEVPVDWVWVPSYGDETTLKKHKARAKSLATVTVGTSSAVAQTQNTAMKKPGETQELLPGFGHAAGEGNSCNVSKHGGLVELGWARQPPPTKRAKPSLTRIK